MPVGNSDIDFKIYTCGGRYLKFHFCMGGQFESIVFFKTSSKVNPGVFRDQTRTGFLPHTIGVKFSGNIPCILYGDCHPASQKYTDPIYNKHEGESFDIISAKLPAEPPHHTPEAFPLPHPDNFLRPGEGEME